MSLEALIGGLVAVLLTLLVFSRLLGDNPAFRVAQYLFVGTSLGYAFVVVYHQVLRPNAIVMAGSLANPAQLAFLVVPWALGLLLIARLTRRQQLSWVANVPLALLFGIGTALAVGGALKGTLVPQLLDSARPVGGGPLQILGSVLLVLGVVLTLCYFYFTVPRTTAGGSVVAFGARIGRWLLMVAFGFFFAGALLSYITALNARIEFILAWFRAPLG